MPPTTQHHQILKPRREYNQWVANETLEDFALRYTARRARRWSFGRIANTALGTTSFLVLELLGATIALSYGVYHSLWAITVVCAILFLSGLPISYYATRYGVDIDLLTRGAGFGYIGSTISSLIYASFTFIFFALEAAIMASALEFLLGLPLWLGYIISALVVIPLVTYGIAIISRFQLITQPLWLLLQLAPFIYVAQQPNSFIQDWLNYSGTHESAPHSFNIVIFGSATAVLFSLIAQIGEQVDFLRFLPESKRQNKRWWAAVIIAGPGWVFIGALKLILGTMLAYLLLQQGFDASEAADPIHMYVAAFSHFTASPMLAIGVAAIFVIICQIKINVANAYAGSLAWSNFFSRLTHHHPGRVVWLLFNVVIALMLMELGVYRVIETVLHHYSAFVLSWFGAIVADLTINKSLGLSPKHIEFKRSRLYDINPVGLGSMIIATSLGLLSSIGMFGETFAAMSGFIAFFIPFITAPAIAWLTRSAFYLVNNESDVNVCPASAEKTCMVCDNTFDNEDMSLCPAYQGHICSLCCALETRCKDACRPSAHLSAQLSRFFRPILPKATYQLLSGPLGQFALVFTIIFALTACIFLLPYLRLTPNEWISQTTFLYALATIFFLLMILIGVLVWLFVLAQKSTRLALVETHLQTEKLSNEISAHKNTLTALDQARRTADSANIAKSNYVTSLSHELRTPLNVILGYTQILQQDNKIIEHHKESLAILSRNGEHLAAMIEGLLEISKIEAGKISLNSDLVRLDMLLEQLTKMFKQQAAQKGLYFHYACSPNVPSTIKVDEKRLRQILMNLLSNAVKFTEHGGITFSVMYRGLVARFRVSDTGSGINDTEMKNIFNPFERGEYASQNSIPGSGLGLAICRQLANIMGAEIEVESTPGSGSTFTLLLQASPAQNAPEIIYEAQTIIGYQGEVKSILVVDDNYDHRKLVADLLSPLGFTIIQAHNHETSVAALTQHIDLALLDLRLGEDSGWDVATALRQQTPKVPILITSANARGLPDNMANQDLYDDYLEKPLQLNTLVEKVGHLLFIEWVYRHDDNINKDIISSTTDTIRPMDCQSVKGDHLLKDMIDLAKIANLNDFLKHLSLAKSLQVISTTHYQQLKRCAETYDFQSLVRQLTTMQENSLTTEIHHDT